MEQLNPRQEHIRFDPAWDAASFSLAGNLDQALVNLVKAGLEASNLAMALFAPDDHLAFTSDSFRDLFAVQEDAQTFADIVRHCHANRVGPNISSSDVEPWLVAACAKRRSSTHRAFEIDMCDGRWFWANESVFAGGWLLLVVTEISVLKSNERMLQMARDAAQLAADTDSLTGLFNRRYAMPALADQIEKAAETRQPLSVALIDLDRFKAINDRLGHAAGDRVLCHFAATSRQILRKKDIFARIGGEEFLLIMPNTDISEGATAVERLRHHVETSGGPADMEIGYTLSAGIAALSDETPEQLFHRLDRALYRAKNLGRNRLVPA